MHNLGMLAAILGTRAGTPPTGIDIGTTGSLPLSGNNSSSYIFSPGPTVDGGGKALVVIVLWCTAYGQRNSGHDGDPDTFTVNGASPDAVLMRYIQDTSSNKYVQALVGIWNNPSSGDLVIDFYGGITATGCGAYFMNLGGLAASPLGALVREQFSTGIALPFQLTTTAANSLVVSINGSRDGGNDPFTFDDASFTSLGELSGALYDGTWAVGYRNNLAIGTYDCGGDWTGSDSQRIAGGAFELLAA
jgi:hypothetical protein